MRKKTISLIVASSVFLLLVTPYTPIGPQLRLQIIKQVQATPAEIIVQQGESIQEAINNASSGDTVFVEAGTYYEHVIVNKTVILVGENKSTTVIDGQGTGVVVLGNASDVEVRGFTIQNGGIPAGSAVILGRRSIGTTICECIIRNNVYGITIIGTYGCNISSNLIMNSSWAAIQIRDTNNSHVHGNTIAINSRGVEILTETAINNTFHHNNFIDNLIQAQSFASTTKWDNGTEGNYWSDYMGNDTNGDGVGDTDIPHLGLDNYPLVEPFGDIVDMAPPVADAGQNQSIFQGMTATFDGSGSYDDVGIRSYVWTFTDVTPKMLTGVNPTYRFRNVGNFTVTLNVTDYSDKWTKDTMWVNVSEDNTKPVIDAPYQEPLEPNGDENVTIQVNVTDTQSGVNNVTLSYSINEGADWMNVLMQNLTGHTYIGEIPALPNGTVVLYKITAHDNADNVATKPEDGGHYIYNVIPEFPATIFLLLFITITSAVVIMRKSGERNARAPFVRIYYDN